MDAGIADSSAAIVSDVPVLLINLFESPGLSAVLEGGGGVLEGDCRGRSKVIVDTTPTPFRACSPFFMRL
jgi:3-hydroxyisobutyrate dehydrogenase-like beta-hydroxyacid dehydrogenase